jgi:DNA-binding beta-propeller fold protein YncE
MKGLGLVAVAGAWAMRRGWAVLGACLLVALTAAPAAAQAPALDTAVAKGDVPSFLLSNFDVNVQSGPSGENPTGHVAFDALGTIHIEGAPSCVQVSGKQAVINIRSLGVVTVFLFDGGPPGSGLDRALAAPSGRAPTDCSFTPGSPPGGPVINGDVAIHDAPPPPSTTDQCKNGGYAQFGFGNQGQCVAFVEHEQKAARPTRGARFVYVANSGTGGTPSVSQYGLGTDGLLAPLTPPSVVASGFPFGLAVSPDGKSVYVAAVASILQYDVGANGALSPKSPPTVTAPGAPDGVAVSPDGKSVYAANFGNSVSQFDVGAGGALSAKVPVTVAAGQSPEAVAVSPGGKNVYVANFGSPGNGSVSQYGVGTGGLLTPLAPPSVAASGAPSGVAVSPDGRSLYVADGAVSQFDVGADGALTPKSPPTVAAFAATAVAVSPDGKSVYAAGDDVVSQFNVGAGGALGPKSPPTVPAGPGAQGVAVTSDGKNVYVTNFFAHTLSQYDVSANGALSPKTPPTVDTGTQPVGVAVTSGSGTPGGPR